MLKMVVSSFGKELINNLIAALRVAIFPHIDPDRSMMKIISFLAELGVTNSAQLKELKLTWRIFLIAGIGKSGLLLGMGS